MSGLKVKSLLFEDEEPTPSNHVEQHGMLQEEREKRNPATGKQNKRTKDRQTISNEKYNTVETTTTISNNTRRSRPMIKPATTTTSHKKRKRTSTITDGKNSQNKRESTQQKKVVRFSPKKKNKEYIADDYDRTPPTIDVFDCDGCSMKILGVRYHCKQCDDFDLCKECAVGPTKISHIHSDYEIIADDDE